jgi:hypothetical protein
MAARRMLSSAAMGSIARIRPSTPCFAALYCGAPRMPCHEATSDGSVGLFLRVINVAEPSYAPIEPIITIAFHASGARSRLT